METPLRRALVVSALLHVVLLAGLIIELPAPDKQDQPEEMEVTMEMVGPPQQSAKAPKAAEVPAPADVQTPSSAPQPAPEPPKPQPEEPPPPPPPPPATSPTAATG